MKPLILSLFAALAATAMLADDAPAAKPLDPKLERVVRDSLMRCKEMTLTQEASPITLPPAFSSMLIKIASPRPICEGQFIGVTSRAGGFYLGVPWLIKDAEGSTIEERIKNFTWKNMHDTFEPQVDHHVTADGLFPVTLWQMTERGKVPMEGEVDIEGKVFFLGHFRRPTDDVKAVRLKAFQPFLATAPQEGSSKPKVTVIEFSDFECPSCRHASGYLDPIVSKYGDQVRYVRYDLPLTMHPWAFAASMAGRAIYRQKPALFWDYKKTIYENQERLSAFMIDDFARNFAKDHDLDMAKYDKDVASQEIRDDLLKASGAAFSNDIRSTPTYLVNGVMLDPGDGGKALEEYVASLLK
jgi:protein-disulfide isomerase